MDKQNKQNRRNQQLTSEQKRKFAVIRKYKAYEREYYSMEKGQRCSMLDPSDILDDEYITFDDFDQYEEMYGNNDLYD